ncbi:hypothetical protein E2C01_098159 [Portunus trituberculatus]|uniref:Uncharacterized protein n=1 Tax=Portunus trituberculatus TaxID=210409 RepID=A0A5B7KBE8_PORTR|nr:hypothetical protein [Portunus trituberculatus]
MNSTPVLILKLIVNSKMKWRKEEVKMADEQGKEKKEERKEEDKKTQKEKKEEEEEEEEEEGK